MDDHDKISPKPNKPGRPTRTRVIVWIVVVAVGLYMIGSGLFGILTH